MKRIRRVVEMALVVLLVIAAGAAGAAWYYARSSIPTYAADLRAAGLDGEVTIYRDAYAVPHIYASTVHDLFFAQGWVQAQDRLWEMDLSRRAVAGRLSEILGAEYVDADYFLRTIGFYRAVKASIATYPPDVAAIGQAYSDGVNAFITQADGRFPIEFSVLGYEPEPWTTTDSAAIGKYMAWVLGGNMSSELFYLALVDKLGPAKVAELFPIYPNDGPVITQVPYPGFATGETGLAPKAPASPAAAPAGLAVAPAPGQVAAIGRLLEVIAQARLGLGSPEAVGLGSNNWVVSGQHTDSGKPLLANDMHLEIKQPAIWYQNHLACPAEGYNVTGVIFPGIPGVIVGHNERVAWGVTNVGPDVQDLYIEKPNPANPHEFEYNGKWEPATVYEEKIKVKGQTEPVAREVVVTRHGPIITGLFGAGSDEGGAPSGETNGSSGGEAPAPALPPLALRWTALDATCELQAVLGFDRARNWDDFRLALESFKAPAQNFVFADVDGNIAYRANGLIPIRKPAAVAAGNGLLPVPGWTDAYEWQGYVPWDGLPTLYNPPSGIVVTANHRVAGDDYTYFISSSWASPYRAASIWQELRGRSGLAPEDMQAIQNDVKNLQASRLEKALAAAIAPALGAFSATEKAAWDLMDGWAKDNPKDEAALAAPTIYHTFYLQAMKATFADELGDDLFEQFLEAGTPTNTFDAMLLSGESVWFDDVTTPDKVESLSDTLVATFKTTVAKLSERFGDKTKGWEWGKVHTVTFDHPMGSVSLLRPFVNVGPFATSGSDVTACAKGYSAAAALGGPNSPGLDYSVQTGAPWRFVADLSDLDHCFDVMAAGESGQPFSPHYADQAGLWLDSQDKLMLFDRGEIEASDGVQVTVLKPGP